MDLSFGYLIVLELEVKILSRVKEKEALLTLRGKLAFEAKDGHSWSFSDAELESLLNAQPKTLDELGVIKGFPRKGKRVEAYGKNIIDIFNGVSIDGFSVSKKGDTLDVKTIMKKSTAFK